MESTKPDELEQDEAMQLVQEALQGLKFGVVTITVQDGKVVQVDRTEKRRLLSGD